MKTKVVVVNVWKSVYTGCLYEMPTEWLPRFGGWELVDTLTYVEEEQGVRYMEQTIYQESLIDLMLKEMQKGAK